MEIFGGSGFGRQLQDADRSVLETACQSMEISLHELIIPFEIDNRKSRRELDATTTSLNSKLIIGKKISKVIKQPTRHEAVLFLPRNTHT